MVLNPQQISGLSLVLRSRVVRNPTARLPLRSLRIILPHTRPNTTAAQAIDAQAMSMFANAVQKHSREDALKKSLFPSSSPSNLSQSTSQSGYPTSNAFTREQLTPNSSTLTSNSSVQNRNVPSRSDGALIDRKRKIPDGQGFASTLNKNGFREERSIIVTDDDSVRQTSVSQPNGSIFFDENDFDSDVDFDAESPKLPTKKYTKPVSKFVTTGATNILATPGHKISKPPPSSDVPLPWSSSPEEHFRVPSKKRSLQSINNDEVISAATVEQPSKDAVITRAPKRRTLPWSTASNEVEQEQNSESGGQSVQQRSDYKTPAKKQSTPMVPKADRDLHLFNQTASTVKREQKRLRQTNKKMVKDSPVTETTRAIAIQELKKKKPYQVFLSEEQKKVADLVVNTSSSQSVFFTGSAGTGKSVLLRELIKQLKAKYQHDPDAVAVTASTGLAACNIGGVTLHSFSGIGLGKEKVDDLVRKVKKNAKAFLRWKRTKTLIIDEVSMVDGELFDKLEELARRIRGKGQPFGGIQLVITGDFFQLPPVPDGGKMARFSFEANTWSTCIHHTIGLTKVFRQKDPVFAGFLNEMRLGKISNQCLEMFQSLVRPIKYDDGLDATELFPTRVEVDRANFVRLKGLKGQSHLFKAMDSGKITDVTQRTKILSNCIAPQEIELKTGAQVMLIKNLDESLVNGSLGKVIGFMDEHTFEIYKNDEEEFIATQDMHSDDETMSEAQRKLKKAIKTTSTARLWPMVRFTLANGTTRDLLCTAENWKTELPNGEIQAQRDQIPLILAWALSIHKAQGQTLERVKVDLGKVFEKGQAYVALSRATSQAGLQVLRFEARKVMAHEKVRGFYDGLYNVDRIFGGESYNAQLGKMSGKHAGDYERKFLQDELH